MVWFFIGVLFGGALTLAFVQQHYNKRMNKAFWLWVDEQKIKGTICEEELKSLSKDFNDKTKGMVTFHKQDE